MLTPEGVGRRSGVMSVEEGVFRGVDCWPGRVSGRVG